ncbi:response regulator transcription factor [Parasulfuritortus cantonensis]|uniref:Response regulator transcription factor n=1 Tax=Parasulfuritortus cantonensis TaxID=2528202 RepID=A0A4R1B718_9PROT|nr:response regulator transcription factor [Parasulfuritortus cantonensis]TCJ11905.1 response regulator transcription factor [Parasulfuritortus cantonensis]
MLTKINPPPRPTVFVVDDNVAVRDAIRWLVEQVGLPVKAYANASEFLAAYRPGMRGCLVLDIRMPGMSGIELQERLARAGVHLPVIIVTGHGDIPIAVRAMKAGAFEFLQKPFNDQALLDAIQAALEKFGQVWEREDRTSATSRNLASLTPREREVLEQLRHGKLNKAIAGDLGLSVRTVEGHRAKIMEKMGARTLGQLIEMIVKTVPGG